jgi:hypothetical protein
MFGLVKSHRSNVTIQFPQARPRTVLTFSLRRDSEVNFSDSDIGQLPKRLTWAGPAISRRRAAASIASADGFAGKLEFRDPGHFRATQTEAVETSSTLCTKGITRDSPRYTPASERWPTD